MITLELPYDPHGRRRVPTTCPRIISPTLRALWRRDADGYLRAVEPGVHDACSPPPAASVFDSILPHP